MSVNEEITTRVAAAWSKDDWVVDRIVSFHLETAKIATHTNNTVEITGLGKFIFRPSTAKRRIKNLNGILEAYNNQLSLQAEGTKEYKSLVKKINSATKERDYLQEKINKDEL